MKPIQNFRDKLNGQVVWIDGVNYNLTVPMTGPENLLWVMPQYKDNNYDVYIKFDWEHQRAFFYRRFLTDHTSVTHLYSVEFTNDEVRNYSDFIQVFLYPQIQTLWNQNKFHAL